MRKILILILLLFACTASFAQKSTPEAKRDSILCNIEDAVKAIQFDQENYGRYKIYQTENIHILIKLDTAYGIIKVVQWSFDRDKEFEVYINSDFLAGGELAQKGRFELYPTKNMYMFILLDTIFGSTWHVQWGTKEGENWIRKIPLF